MPRRVLATGSADTEAIRLETFRGREYTVVPVVMLVEGVLHGLNAANPEFASADEFAKFPAGWNGRPVTMDHPRNDDGNLCSANDPIILEAYQMGFLANSTRDDIKLKSEAWIDNELVADKGGNFESTLGRLNAGETLVEVSTGLFTDVIPHRGVYHGLQYNGTWQSVVPDHLAMLPEGAVGACSAEDGCGAPRLNTALRVHREGEGASALTTLRTVAPLNLGAPPQPCCSSCAEGGPCMAGNNTNANNESPGGTENATEGSGQADPVAANEENSNGRHEQREGTSGRGEPRAEEAGRTADASGRVQGESAGTGSQPSQQLPEQVTAALVANERAAQLFERFRSNQVDPNITFDNAMSCVQDELCEYLPYNNVYVVAMTVDQAVFMVSDWDSADYGETYSIGYTVDADGNVEFTGEPVPVTLLTRIVQDMDDSGVAANASGANQQQEGTVDMAGENQNAAPPEGENTATDGAGGEVSTNASGAEASSAPRTLESYLAEAPEELRDVLQEGVDMRAQKRAKLISAIVANSNGVYKEEDLKGRTMADLEKLATLCAPKDDFGGRAFPSAHRAPGINSNASNEITEVPRAPKAFERVPYNTGHRTVNADQD